MKLTGEEIVNIIEEWKQASVNMLNKKDNSMTGQTIARIQIETIDTILQEICDKEADDEG